MKQLFRYSVMLLALLLPALATAHDFEVDGIYYNIKGNEAAVTFEGQYYFSFDEYSGSVVIPASVTYNGITYPVTSIEAVAFFSCTGLTSIDIPNSVTEIGYSAFLDCPGLASIVVESSNPRFDSRNNCNAIIETANNKLIHGCKNTTIPNSVTEIGLLAFADCSGLTSIDIPNSVTAIGERAFEGCTGLTSIDIPNSVTEIGYAVFEDCPELANIVVESGNPRYDSRNNCNAIIETANNTLVYGCKNTTIPNSVTAIGDFAFYCITGLTSIDIPNSVTEIGESAFFRCTGLTSINIPNSVTFIGYGAFEYCSGLTSIDIPNSVIEIGYEAFGHCTGLTSIVIPNSVTSIGSYAFYNCSGLTSIDIPNSVTSIGSGAFSKTAWYNNQPEGLVYAGMVAYKYKGTMPSETNMTLKEGTLGIAGGAFTDCTGLTSIDIPNSVTSIGIYAFEFCTGLTSIIIPNSVTSIGDGAFFWCTGLTDVYSYIADLSRVSSGNELFYLDNGDYSGRTLHVLHGTADAYQADERWYPYFGQIVDDLISETQPGDVNGDREVNIADVNAVIDIILGGVATSDIVSRADVNSDGEVNIADINAVIGIILGGSVQPEPDYVDLGLPSGTLWATRNVGANSPEDYGNYFAWGEISPKEVYNWNTYKWCNGSYTTITKYCTNSEYGYNGFVDNKTELDLEDDAAYVNWGPSWCMPTVEQQQELYQNCSSVWTTKNGVNGRLFTGPNGNTLFLPAAGGRWDGSLYYVGSYGYYWSRTLYTCFSRSDLAYNLDFTSGYVGCDGDDRIIGFTVRAVRVSQN